MIRPLLYTLAFIGFVILAGLVLYIMAQVGVVSSFLAVLIVAVFITFAFEDKV